VPVTRLCIEPRCPRPAVARGYCRAHARTTSARGYGTEHQQRRARLVRGGACAECGTTRGPLHLDHRVPRSLGGTDRPENLRLLCGPCHARVGRRSSSVVRV